MGYSRSPLELSRKLERAAVALGNVDATVVRECAQHTKATITAGAPSRLRGVGRNGARLTVGYTLTHSATTPAALVFARGPWQLIERDTKAGVRTPRGKKRGKGRRLLVVPGGAEGGVHGKGGVRASINHPGTRGKHPWRKGVERAEPGNARLLANRSEAVLRAVFR